MAFAGLLRTLSLALSSTRARTEPGHSETNRSCRSFVAMDIEELSHLVQPGGIFRTGQILAGQHSPQDVRRQIDRWVKSGRVLKLRRGVYMLTKPYVGEAAHPFAVANALKKASYVSLQSALAHYGMIPEHVPVTTSVTTGRPEEVGTQLGRLLSTCCTWLHTATN